MKKEKALALLTAISTSLVLSACVNPFEATVHRGDKGLFNSANDKQSGGVASESIDDELKEVLSLMQKETAEGLTQEEYMTLASLCEEKGMMRAKRDVLEDAYRIFQDPEILEECEDISVNGLEESDEVIALLDAVLTGMSTGTEDLSEAIDAIEEDKSFETLMPKLKEGRRTYFYEEDSEPYFVLTVGFNENGEKTLEAYFFDRNTKTCYVLTIVSNSVTYYKEAGEFENLYDVFNKTSSSTFEKLTVDSYSGVMKKETGSLKDGKLFGDYEVVVSYFDNYAKDKTSVLIKNQEDFTKVVFKGTFDENGKPTVEALSDKNIEKLVKTGDGKTAIAYAYTEDLMKCLYKEVSIDEKDNVFFEKAELSIPSYPKIDRYDYAKAIENNKKLLEARKPATKVGDGEQLVKIVDSKIFVCLDGEWIEYGNLSDIEGEDPFLKYNQKSDGVITNVNTGTESNIVKEVASIDSNKVEETTKNTTTGKTQTSTSKPATSTKKPVVTTPAPQAPTQTPAPQPAPAAQPSQG
ncbi:MAG: hypothetical protein IJM28_04605, partial [Lachnospiraceae bacterium]|nr:hypothetical protein [Lachnospiraceae bacterium]